MPECIMMCRRCIKITEEALPVRVAQRILHHSFCIKKKEHPPKWVFFVSANNRLALGELRSTTSGLQTVLLKAARRKPLRHKALRVWEEELTSNLTAKRGA